MNTGQIRTCSLLRCQWSLPLRCQSRLVQVYLRELVSIFVSCSSLKSLSYAFKQAHVPHILCLSSLTSWTSAFTSGSLSVLSFSSRPRSPAQLLYLHLYRTELYRFTSLSIPATLRCPHFSSIEPFLVHPQYQSHQCQIKVFASRKKRQILIRTTIGSHPWNSYQLLPCPSKCPIPLCCTVST